MSVPTLTIVEDRRTVVYVQRPVAQIPLGTVFTGKVYLNGAIVDSIWVKTNANILDLRSFQWAFNVTVSDYVPRVAELHVEL